MRHNEQIRHAHHCFEEARTAASAGQTDQALIHIADGLDHLAWGIEFERGHVVHDLSEELAQAQHRGWCR